MRRYTSSRSICSVVAITALGLGQSFAVEPPLPTGAVVRFGSPRPKLDWLDSDKNEDRLKKMQAVGLKAKPEDGFLGQMFQSADGNRVVAIRNMYSAKRRAEVYTFAPNTPLSEVKLDRSIPLGDGYNVWLSKDEKILIAHVNVPRVGERLTAFDLTAVKDADKPVWEIAYHAAGDHRATQMVNLDGKKLLVAFLNGDLEIWDGPAGKVLHVLPKTQGRRFRGYVEHLGLALSPDGKRVAVINRQKTGEMAGRVYDMNTGKDVVTLAPGPMTSFGSAAFSPDGKQIALTGGEAVRVWNAETGADADPRPGHYGRINSVATSADGKLVVTAGDDLSVRGWDPTTGVEKWRTMFAHRTTVCFVTPDGVVVQEDQWTGGPAWLIDWVTGRAKPLPGTNKDEEALGRHRPLAISPNGKTLATLDAEIALKAQPAALKLWSWPAGELQKSIPLVPPDKHRVEDISAAQFTADGKQLAIVIAYTDPNERELRRPRPQTQLELWDVVNGKRVEQPAKGDKAILGFTWNAKNVHGAIRAEGGGYTANGIVQIFDNKTDQLIAILNTGDKTPQKVAFLPDGRLVTAGETALIWAADAKDRVKPPEKK